MAYYQGAKNINVNLILDEEFLSVIKIKLSTFVSLIKININYKKKIKCLD